MKIEQTIILKKQPKIIGSYTIVGPKEGDGNFGGYFDYTGRDEAKDADKTVEKQEDGYFGYTGSHTIGTYSSMGVLNTKENRSQFKKEINRCFHKNGNLCWDYVISLESDDEAHQLELETGEQWAAVMKEVLPKLFKQYDLDYHNVLWWFDVHRNTEHPHIHLAFMEKKQTDRTGEEKDSQTQNEDTEIQKEELLSEIVRSWSNGQSEWAFSYMTTFYDDGTVICEGHRNRDCGTFEIIGENTILATFNENSVQVPGSDYEIVHDYIYSVTYTYNSDDDTLYADYDTTFEEAFMSNASDGVLY